MEKDLILKQPKSQTPTTTTGEPQQNKTKKPKANLL